MKTTETRLLSNCCDAKTSFVPPSLGEMGFYVCEECSAQTGVYKKEVQTHVKIAEGVYRPIENMEV